MFSFFKKKQQIENANQETDDFLISDLKEYITQEQKNDKNSKKNKIVINLDKFMEFNIEFGFETGNFLLKKVKKRIKDFFKSQQNSPEEEIEIYHLSPDCFILNVEDYQTDKEFIKKLIEEIEFPYTINGKKTYIKVRIGVSSNKYENFKNVLYSTKFAKEKDKNIVYTSAINNEKEKIKEKFKILGILKETIEQENVIPYYQPVIDKNNNINHYEILIRIKNNSNLLFPHQFLDIAKDFRIYIDLSKNIIKKTIQLYQEKNIPFSINLHMEDLENKSFRKFLLNSIDEFFPKDYDRENFHIEISLSRELIKQGEIVKFLELLKEKNIKLILDDFGKGFNNIEVLYLLENLIWGIKYSGSLIQNIINDPLKQITLKHLNAALKAMNIITIAKFVESKEIKDFLVENNVDYFQGFFCSVPQDLS